MLTRIIVIIIIVLHHQYINFTTTEQSTGGVGSSRQPREDVYGRFAPLTFRP